MLDDSPLPVDPDPEPAIDGVDLLAAGSVALGGIIGAAMRYAIVTRWPIEPGRFPWSTFAVNMAGSLVLGLALVVFAGAGAGVRVRSLVSTGVLGAFTTMSGFLVEATVLGEDGHLFTAVGYVAATLVVGLLAAASGIRLGRLAVLPVDERTGESV